VLSTVENNAISVQLIPDAAGSLQDDEVDQFWKLSSLFSEDESDFKPQLRGLNQCSNNTVASATISRLAPETKSHLSHDQSKVQKTVLRRPSNEHIPHLRGHKNRSEHPSANRQFNKDKIVQFKDSDELMDLDIDIHGRTDVSNDTKLTPMDKQPRRKKLVDKLEPDAHAVIRSILSTTIPLSISTLLGNMPEVRKNLFSSGYTNEELSKLEVNSAAKTNQAEKDKGELVEAKGEAIECYSLKAEHWTDPEINHIQQHIITDQFYDHEDIADDDYDHPKSDRKPYDRSIGIEHLRRDCPKVPVDIRGNSFLALLDSGAELNTIKREAAERAMLPITSLPGSMKAARMVSANGSTASFVGIVWGVPIIIGQIEVRTNFFVVESCTNPIILGNPFLTDSRARIEYATNGLTYCRIFSVDGQSNTRFACARSNRLTSPNLYAGPTAGKGMGV
jgi:hypothetical protein